jgi:hypothetical protein
VQPCPAARRLIHARFRLDEEGRVAELTVMLRPMSGMTAMADAMRQRLAPA